MALKSSQPLVTAVLDDEHDAVQSAACPMCHTPAALTRSAVVAGGEWRCARCGQHWDAVRLAAVAAYAAWVVERNATDG
jgi:ribosomal protein L37AE/L43A